MLQSWRAAPWWVRASALLVVLTVSSFLAVSAAPDDGHVIGIWPVGVASGLLLWTPRRTAPLWLPVVLLVGVLSVWTGDRPFAVAVGYAVAITAETALVWAVLSAGHPRGWRLRSDDELRRWLGAGLLGGLVGGGGGALTSLLTGFGDPAFIFLALGSAHLASQLTLTPIWASLPRHGSIARPGEHVLQWTALLVVAPAVFTPGDFPSLTFVLIPLLAWSALRIGPREALAQMVMVLAFAILMTTDDLGPFAAAPELFGLHRDARGVLLAAYAVTCALIVVPLMLRVGESVETARAARTERDTLDRIVRSATGVAIIGADPQGRITLFNPGAERMLGYSAEEVMGRRTRMFHSRAGVRAKAAELGLPADFSQVAARLMEPDKAGTDMGFVRKDGVERTHSMTLSRVVGEKGETLGFVSTSEDVTDRVVAADALRSALERMKEVDAVKDAFVSSVSHELRTPITSIHGYLEMLLDGSFGDLTAEQQRAVERIAANGERLLSLIDDLLTLSRLQEDGLNLVHRVVDLRRVVADGCAVVAPSIDTGVLALEIDLPADPVPFLGDRDMLERVVVNLVGNAVKFTPKGGRIDVVLEPWGEGTRLEVRDTGIGIPETEQEHLFTRFFRSSLAQQQAIPGSGLGLSIAHAVVSQHGGTMHVSSRPGEGTTFVVELPAMV